MYIQYYQERVGLCACVKDIELCKVKGHEIPAMRRRRSALKVVKELDAFPKVEDDYAKPTTRGGTFSILSLSVITVLVVSEFFYYRGTEVRYKYSVDIDMNAQLLISLDITVAMQCRYLGADLIDHAGESKQLNDVIKMEPVGFELNEIQLSVLRAKQRLQQHYNDAKAVGDLTIIEGIRDIKMPQAGTSEGAELDSCRLHGAFEVKKLAGNFHITTGRSIPHPQGHAHLNMYVPREAVNYSHRIDHLSFGPPIKGVLNPLDAAYQITDQRSHQFQYYMQVVPTKFRTLHNTLTTNQYSVRERNRTIDHGKGSHGMAGIFFKYDMSPLMVDVDEERRPFWQFLIRLIGIVGGIFATSGMLNALVGSLTDGVLSCLFSGKDKKLSGNSQEPKTTPD